MVRLKSVVVLALVVAALGTFAWFVDRDRPGSAERRQTADRVLILDSEAITGLTIENEDRTVELERTGKDRDPGATEAEETESEWWLRRPLAARADTDKVEGLIDALTELDRERRLEDVDPADYGLDAPRWRLTVATEHGSREVAVGSEVPGLNRVAITVDGSAVELVPDLWLDRLDPDGTGWRSPRLFSHQRSQILSIRLGGTDGGVTLERRGDGFRLTAPETDRADRSLVDSLLAAIVGLSAQAYVAEENLKVGAGMIEVGLPEGSSWTLRQIGDDLVQVGDAVARVEEPVLFEALVRTVEEWRSPAWSPFDGYDVEQALFIDADGETRLQRVEGDWQRDGAPIAFSAATGPLYAAADAEAEAFVARDRTGGGEPMLELVLTGEDETRRLAMFLRPDEGGCIGTVDDREVALILPQEACDGVREGVAAMRQAEPIGARDAEAEGGTGSAESD